MEEAAAANATPEATDEDASGASASDQGQATASEQAPAFDMNAALRGVLNPDRPTSKPDNDDDGASEGGASASGEGSSGGVKPPGIGRRGAAGEIARLSSEVERLTALVNDINPKVPEAAGPDARAEAIERESRYRALLQKPAASLSSDEYDFVETEKERREKFPELQAHYDAVIDADRAALRQAHDAHVSQFWDGVRAELASTLTLPGLTDDDRARLRATPSWADQVAIHRAAERRLAADRIQKLERDLRDARVQALGGVRAPVAGGRSSGSGASGFDMNRVLRGA